MVETTQQLVVIILLLTLVMFVVTPPDVGGYGQDVAAYRPAGAATGEWIGFDLVAGAGAPGATVIWNRPLTRRVSPYGLL